MDISGDHGNTCYWIINVFRWYLTTQLQIYVKASTDPCTESRECLGLSPDKFELYFNRL